MNIKRIRKEIVLVGLQKIPDPIKNQGFFYGLMALLFTHLYRIYPCLYQVNS